MPIQGICSRCKYISSQELCKACVMLDGLNKGMPRLGIGKSSKVKGALRILDSNQNLQRVEKKCSKSKRLSKLADKADETCPSENPTEKGCGGSCLCENQNETETQDQEETLSCQSDSFGVASVADSEVSVDIENLGLLAKTMLNIK